MSLFSPFRIGPLELPNRVVMAPRARARAHVERRIWSNACAETPLGMPDTATFYSGGDKGYIDYPFLSAAAC